MTLNEPTGIEPTVLQVKTTNTFSVITREGCTDYHLTTKGLGNTKRERAPREGSSKANPRGDCLQGKAGCQLTRPGQVVEVAGTQPLDSALGSTEQGRIAYCQDAVEEKEVEGGDHYRRT